MKKIILIIISLSLFSNGLTLDIRELFDVKYQKNYFKLSESSFFNNQYFLCMNINLENSNLNIYAMNKKMQKYDLNLQTSVKSYISHAWIEDLSILIIRVDNKVLNFTKIYKLDPKEKCFKEIDCGLLNINIPVNFLDLDREILMDQEKFNFMTYDPSNKILKSVTGWLIPELDANVEKYKYSEKIKEYKIYNIKYNFLSKSIEINASGVDKENFEFIEKQSQIAKDIILFIDSSNTEYELIDRKRPLNR